MKKTSLWESVKTKEDVLFAMNAEETFRSIAFEKFIKSKKLEAIFPSHYDILRNGAVRCHSIFRFMLRGLISESISIDDVIGYQDKISKVKEEIDFGSKVFLFYGPPGNGKSLFARAVASSFSTVIYLPVSTLIDFNSEWITLFFESIDSKNVSLVIDEFDFLERSSAERIKAALLRSIENKNLKNLKIFLTTSEPWRVDYMFFRKGRIDHSLYFHTPDLEMRRKVLAKHNADASLAERTRDFSVSELIFVANRVSRGVPFEKLHVVPAYHEWRTRMRYCDPAQLCTMLPELKREFDGVY